MCAESTEKITEKDISEILIEISILNTIYSIDSFWQEVE